MILNPFPHTTNMQQTFSWLIHSIKCKIVAILIHFVFLINNFFFYETLTHIQQICIRKHLNQIMENLLECYYTSIVIKHGRKRRKYFFWNTFKSCLLQMHLQVWKGLLFLTRFSEGKIWLLVWRSRRAGGRQLSLSGP